MRRFPENKLQIYNLHYPVMHNQIDPNAGVGSKMVILRQMKTMKGLDIVESLSAGAAWELTKSRAFLPNGQ